MRTEPVLLETYWRCLPAGAALAGGTVIVKACVIDGVLGDDVGAAVEPLVDGCVLPDVPAAGSEPALLPPLHAASASIPPSDATPKR